MWSTSAPWHVCEVWNLWRHSTGSYALLKEKWRHYSNTIYSVITWHTLMKIAWYLDRMHCMTSVKFQLFLMKQPEVIVQTTLHILKVTPFSTSVSVRIQQSAWWCSIWSVTQFSVFECTCQGTIDHTRNSSTTKWDPEHLVVVRTTTCLVVRGNLISLTLC